MSRFQPHSDRSAAVLGHFVQARVLLGLHSLLRRNELLGDPLPVLSLSRRDWRRQDRQIEPLRQPLQQHRQIRQPSPGSKILLATYECFLNFFKVKKEWAFQTRLSCSLLERSLQCKMNDIFSFLLALPNNERKKDNNYF